MYIAQIMNKFHSSNVDLYSTSHRTCLSFIKSFSIPCRCFLKEFIEPWTAAGNVSHMLDVSPNFTDKQTKMESMRLLLEYPSFKSQSLTIWKWSRLLISQSKEYLPLWCCCKFLEPTQIMWCFKLLLVFETNRNIKLLY